MKVEFDDWRTCCNGSSFVIDMNCAPLVGEEIWIDKDLFSKHYFEGCYAEDPPDELNGLIKTIVQIVAHRITKSGHTVRVCIDV